MACVAVARRLIIGPHSESRSNVIAAVGPGIVRIHCPSVGEPEQTCLEAKGGHDVAALVFDRVGTLGALEGGLGIFIAERRGFLVIRLGGA